MTLNLFNRDRLALLFFMLFVAGRATAGPVYLYLAVDPAATAGAGVPTIARDFSTGSFSVTSTLSGAGTWHLYALDDLAGSFGLASFNVDVHGGSGHLNRSTEGVWENYDTPDDPSQNSGRAGFADPTLRSGVSIPPNPIVGGQEGTSPQRITGMGISAGNLNNTPNLPVPVDHRQWSSVVSGQWGNYATDPDPINGKNWLLLGEGNYSGALQIGPVTIYHYDRLVPLGATLVPQTSIQVFGGCSACFAPTVQDIEINNVKSEIPGSVIAAVPFQVANTISPLSWSGLVFDSYVGPAGTATPKHVPQFNTTTHNFFWDTTGSPIGTYTWLLTASNYYGADQGSITVHITAVPEPTALYLVSLATIGGIGVTQRRRA